MRWVPCCCSEIAAVTELSLLPRHSSWLHVQRPQRLCVVCCSLKLKEMYQMITLGGDAELELVDTLDPFSEVSRSSPQAVC